MKKALCIILVVFFVPSAVIAGDLLIYNDCSRCSAIRVAVTVPASTDEPAYEEAQLLGGYGLSVAFDAPREGTYRVYAICTGADLSWDFTMDLTGGIFETDEKHLTCGSSGGCLAETIYGTDSAETALLRSLRDNVLSKTHEGRELIKLYYQWSPLIVEAMEADADFKADVKALVDEIMGMIE